MIFNLLELFFLLCEKEEMNYYTYKACECSVQHAKVPGVSIQITEQMIERCKKHLKWEYFNDYEHGAIITLDAGLNKKTFYTFFIDNMKYKVEYSFQLSA